MTPLEKELKISADTEGRIASYEEGIAVGRKMERDSIKIFIEEAMPEKQMSHIPNDFDNGWNDCRTQLKQNLEKILHNQKEV